MNVVMAWVFMQGLGLFLFCYWGTHFVGVWGPKEALTVMQWLWEVFLHFGITQWPLSVLKSVSVCLKLLYNWFNISSQTFEMGKKFTIKFDLHCFIFQPEKFIVVTACTDYGNNSFGFFFLIRLMCFQISWSHLNKILTFHSIEMPVVSVT